MAQRVVLVVLVLWSVWGMGRLLPDADEESGADALGADALGAGEDQAAIAFGTGARLASRPTQSAEGAVSEGAAPEGAAPEGAAPEGGVSEGGVPESGVPPAFLGVSRILESPQRAAFVRWVRARPERLLTFLLRAPGLEQGGRLDKTVSAARFRDAMLLLGAPADALSPSLPHLLGAFARVDADPGEQTAILGALACWDAPGASTAAALLTYVCSAGAPRRLRPFVVILLAGLEKAEEKDAVAAAAALLYPNARHDFLDLLREIEGLPSDRRIFLRGLRGLHNRVLPIWGIRAELLETLRRIDPEDPRVVEATLQALGGNGRGRTLARAWFLGGGPERRQQVLEALATTRGPALVNGVALLLETTGDAASVGHLLLPALHDRAAVVRARAVALLARSGQSNRDVLPHVEELLASAEPARWLTATQALGALGSTPGDQRAVVDLLFKSVRMPSPLVRAAAVQALLMHDDHRERIVPLLADLLRDSEASVRKEALDGLGELSSQDPGVRVHLQAALTDPDEAVRDLASYWLTEEDDGAEEDDDDE